MEIAEPRALTVTQLTRQIKNAVEQRPEFQSVWVRGEISNLTAHSNGHVYLSLKDENSQIRAVIFSRHAKMLREPLKDGMEVFALGSISVYEKRGEYQLYITAVKLAGQGALFLQFEQLKQKLMSEGLFDAGRKLPIPALPRRIAVVTSPTGAAVRDVINIITRRFPRVELTLAPALVQGNDAPASIRSALARAAELPGVDTILLVRGGGSYEDLWAFNDEALARDIAACRIPIISGIGHETDFTIADFVADLRAPTPSAAAESAVPELKNLLYGLSSITTAMNRGIANRLAMEKTRLLVSSSALAPRRLTDIINQRRQYVDDLVRMSQLHLKHRIETALRSTESISRRLAALDPYAVLRRGYSVLKDATTGRLITSTARTSAGREIAATLSDGEIRAVVIQVKRGSSGEPERGPGELEL